MSRKKAHNAQEFQSRLERTGQKCNGFLPVSRVSCAVWRLVPFPAGLGIFATLRSIRLHFQDDDGLCPNPGKDNLRRGTPGF